MARTARRRDHRRTGTGVRPARRHPRCRLRRRRGLDRCRLLHARAARRLGAEPDRVDDSERGAGRRDLAGGDERAPRRAARPPPAVRRDGVLPRPAPVAAAPLPHPRLRRGLGALRRAARRRAGTHPRSGRTARTAARPDLALGAHRGRHRPAHRLGGALEHPRERDGMDARARPADAGRPRARRAPPRRIRGRPLSRLARAGARVQGRRAAVERGPRGPCRRGRRRVLAARVPPRCAGSRPDGSRAAPRPAARPVIHAASRAANAAAEAPRARAARCPRRSRCRAACRTRCDPRPRR